MLIAKLKLDIQPIVFSYGDYMSEDNEFIAQEIKKKGLEITSENSSRAHKKAACLR